MIFTSFFKALAQLSDPRFRKILWRGIGLTLGLLAAITAGADDLYAVDAATLAP